MVAQHTKGALLCRLNHDLAERCQTSFREGKSRAKGHGYVFSPVMKARGPREYVEQQGDQKTSRSATNPLNNVLIREYKFNFIRRLFGNGTYYNKYGRWPVGKLAIGA